jgi:uncharacterized protein
MSNSHPGTTESAHGFTGPQTASPADIGMQLADWAAAVSCARALEGIDHNRIGLWGKSFGGRHVVATAARLPGIKAAVAQCPFTDGVASVRTLSPLTFMRIGVLAMPDIVGAQFGK